MPYVKKNENGEIIGVHATQTEVTDQWVEMGDAEVLMFLKKIETTEQAKQILTSTDNEMVRVVEDLIDLLIAKQVFAFSELPEVVQTKLNARKQVRQDMNALSNSIDDNDPIF